MSDNNNAPVASQIEIKIDGSILSKKLMDALSEAEIETSMYLPSMFILRFYDDELTLLDGSQFSAGKSVEIMLPDTSTSANTLTTVFKGEITAVEPDFSADFIASLVVRGYDKGHRLNRGSKSKVFVQVTDSDIVSQIASGAGLSPQVDATSQVHEHVFQYAVNDWAFIHERARRNNYEVLVDDSKLYFRKASTTVGEATLVWGVSMWSFQPRLTLSKQVGTVKVKGWDPEKKVAIIGEASSSSSSPTIGISGWGGSISTTAFNAAEVVEIRHPVRTQSEATTMAQSILDEINAGFLEADGVAYGTPKLKPGVKVDVQKVGAKFSGKYVVTTARHIYRATETYITQFSVQGARAQTMADLVDQSITEQRTGQLWGGIVTALVTNNNDPKNMARVKLKFPWLDESLESNWARVTGVGAGNAHGFLWLPEINDEVLVAFEHGDFDYPYVVGSLWNGKDAMPETTANAVADGKVVMRTLKTTAGHIIRLTESSSAKTIEIIGSDGKTNIKFDETNQKVTLTSTGDIDLTATGNLNLTATGNVKMEGAQVSINGKSQFEVKGALGKVESSGPLTVKGAVVNIN